jgi:hypothetical protein
MKPQLGLAGRASSAGGTFGKTGESSACRCAGSDALSGIDSRRAVLVAGLRSRSDKMEAAARKVVGARWAGGSTTCCSAWELIFTWAPCLPQSELRRRHSMASMAIRCSLGTSRQTLRNLPETIRAAIPPQSESN